MLTTSKGYYTVHKEKENIVHFLKEKNSVNFLEAQNSKSVTLKVTFFFLLFLNGRASE
jgi:hypothetical protein